eukprot:6537828-Prymnesium_polylepis.1
MRRSETEMSRDGHLTDETIVMKAAEPADDGRTTELPIWHRMFAQRQPLSRSSAPAMPVARRALPRCC